MRKNFWRSEAPETPTDGELKDAVFAHSRRGRFKIRTTAVEMRGICRECN